MKKIDKTDTLQKILENRHFSVDYFQREYRWGRKQIEQMLSDFQNTFEEYYDPENHDSTVEVAHYGYYYMGCIICTEGDNKKIIDGQQRLTSLTLLIYLQNLQKQQGLFGLDKGVDLKSLIYSDAYGQMNFNIYVPERIPCMHALMENDAVYEPDNESTKNLMNRYQDIEELFPEELKGEALTYFIYWLKEKVLLLEIDTPSEDEAHTIFLTMNDRGLSLNSAEMLKAYIIQQVAEADRLEVNRKWQENINAIKAASANDTSGQVNTEDVEFISIWLRAKYAMTLRESKKGSKDRDYELLGEKFHSWVRDYAKEKMHLAKSSDFKYFVMKEMSRMTGLYLRVKQYGAKLTPGLEEVFYNANRDLGYQTMLILATVKNDDPDEIVDKKIRMASKFVDDFASVRIFNFSRVNWNTNKYLLFRVLIDTRNQDCKTMGLVYLRELRRMDANLDGITNFGLNQFTSRYMLHFLARFTSYANVLMGNQSDFNVYVDRKRKGNTYDIEHIMPNKHQDYLEAFPDEEDFQKARQSIGNLIILTRDRNRSYQAIQYEEKVKNYSADNVLAKALNPDFYNHNPQFINKVANVYGFKPMPKITADSIAERTNIYLQMASDIWNPLDIKELAGGWTPEEEREFFKNVQPKEFTVSYKDRSWADALQYGFLSANNEASGRYLKNIQTGDLVFCLIAGFGFVGIGKCVDSAVEMTKFTVTVAGKRVPVAQAPWISEPDKQKLNPEKEIFIRVQWLKTVADPADGYWEKGLTSVPLVAYTLSKKDTYQKVKAHFGYEEK